MPIESVSLDKNNTIEKSIKTDDNSKNNPVSVKFNTVSNGAEPISNDKNEEISTLKASEINRSIFETKNNVDGDTRKSHETQANSLSFGDSTPKKASPVEESFLSKMGSSIKHFFYGSASNKVNDERKELKDILSNDKNSVTKLLDTMEKEDPSNVALVKNMLLSIDNVDSSNSNWKNKPMNPNTEKALITVVEKFKEQIRKSDSQLDPEISAFVNKLDSTKLLEKMQERQEDFHKFNVSVNNVVKVTERIESKISEIRKTDPKTADFLQSLVGEFKNYEKNPALFIMYGQYMKNVLNMMQNSDLKTLQSFNNKFQGVFDKIKSEITSKHTDEEKKQTIMALINENKDVINLNILEGKTSLEVFEGANDEKIKLSDIIQDIFERPESYISRRNTSTDSSHNIVSGQRMSLGMMGSRSGIQVNLSASIDEKESHSTSGETSGGGGGQFVSALSAVSIYDIPQSTDGEDKESSHGGGAKVIGRKLDGRVSAFEFVRHLDQGGFERCRKTINTHLKEEIKEFNMAINEMRSTVSVYKEVNDEYYKEYDKLVEQLEMINELFKTNINTPNNSESLEEDKKLLDELLKKAQEKEDLMDLSISFEENDFSVVSLLENLRSIIVELDLSLRSIKNKNDSKMQIDSDFLRHLKENEKRFQKIDQAREIMNKIFKSSKEVSIINVSDWVKRATFKSDLKVLGLAIQELSAMGVRS